MAKGPSENEGPSRACPAKVSSFAEEWASTFRSPSCVFNPSDLTDSYFGSQDESVRPRAEGGPVDWLLQV